MNFLNKDQDMLKTYVNDISNKVSNIIKKELDRGSISYYRELFDDATYFRSNAKYLKQALIKFVGR